MNKSIGAVDVLFRPSGGACVTPEEALVEMDAAGVAVALVSGCGQWSCEKQWLCVDTRLEDVARFTAASVRFAGLAGYNPFDAVESLREMEAARALGYHGTYLQTAGFDVRLSDARLYPLFAKAAELSQPAVVQVPIGEPDVVRCIERIGRDFPELALALVHPRPTAEMFALCDSFEGLAFVFDSDALARAASSGILKGNSYVERCMWGSDGAPLGESVAAALNAELSEAAKVEVLRGNALRYFATSIIDRLPQALSREVTVAE